MLYLYAFCPPAAKVPAVRGIDDALVAAERFASVDAIVSTLDAASIAPTEQRVLAHASVVDELAAVNDAVVPARFGRGYADRDALDTAIRGREAALTAALVRVRGCVELGLRVLAPATNHAPAATGREYMFTRLERTRQDEGAAADVHDPLSALAREATKSLRATPQLLLSAAYLVERDDLERFRDLLRSQEEAHPDLTFACTGPWPPYSFVTAEPDA